jgi:cytochrome b561
MTVETIAAPAAPRYRAGAIALHWLIAAGLIFLVFWGWYMGGLGRTPAHDSAERLHISVGLTVLILTLVRVGLRLAHRPPPLPAGLPGWERTLSHSAHFLFYFLMLAIPLTGWVMESTGPRPIDFWGLEWPHVPGLSTLPREQARPLHATLESVHGTYLTWAGIVLLGLHVVGALKHQFDGHPVLYRMIPFLPRPVAKR